MNNAQANDMGNNARSTTPVRFWERGRVLYNAILTVIVGLWLGLTWPHFRPSLTLGAFEAMAVLALLANLCYSAAYIGDFIMRAFVAETHWRRFRQVLWLLGMLFAIMLANYWIADEIYPAANQPPPAFILGTTGGTTAMPTAPLASNMNFPAPLAVLGFLALCGGGAVALAFALIAWFARKPKLSRTLLAVTGAGALFYFALLVTFSLSSHSATLARGQEKYFCEVDCHLAYSVVDVKIADTKTPAESAVITYVVTLRTRFDETTTSPSRPKDAPLAPSPRDARLIDEAGREYAPVAIVGKPLLTPLKPADSYTTDLAFQLPQQAKGLRLLLRTKPAWPDHLVIGDENSWLHQKTYFAVPVPPMSL